MGLDPEPPPAARPPRPRWPPSAASIRWIAVWLLLAGVDLAVWALSRRLLAGSLPATVEDLLGLLLIPPLQTAALAGLLAMRRPRG